ncbi:stage II sporulation protein M [Thermobifida halotolerans]|uniref:Stage II sporulation protein M n=1 Tax=Thermobifida halotolerans TaxID=483545 RepID=A0A399G865_9ACTN|nr:stage II sporulation protein M [Thermobifida halotolerans]UOE18210.1 stage II sporulation protein M [Thermobifida halotolerans]
MDLDLFTAERRPSWQRLQRLVRRHRRLTGEEIDELVELYQRVSTDLSVLRSTGHDPALAGWLSGLVARARAVITGAHAGSWRDFGRFFTRSFPAALYRLRWWWLVAMAANLLVAFGVGAWVATTPEAQAALGTPEEISAYVEHDFANYYVEHPGASFAAQVWTNNAWVAAQSIVFGAFLCLPAVYVLLLNSANLGVAGGLMAAHGKADVFFGLILPHGLLELTAVFVAGGVGIRIGWAFLVPGHRTRAQALGQEARAAMGVALGLVVVLFVSGLIEGFVTGWVHITWLRIGIGVVAEALFLLYVFTLGRRAVHEGETGDIADAPQTVAVAG